MTSHRRDFHRFAVNELASLESEGSTAILKDISCRGAGLITYRPLDPRREITLSFQIPFMAGISTRKAKVVWCREAGDGRWHCGLDFGMDNRLSFLS